MELLVVYVVAVVPAVQVAARHQPAVNTVAVAVAAVRIIFPVLLAGQASFVLFGPVQHAHTHQQTQVICNGTLYSNS
jgi:hypothetical protein